MKMMEMTMRMEIPATLSLRSSMFSCIAWNHFFFVAAFFAAKIKLWSGDPFFFLMPHEQLY